jgi:hypothetical protein
MKNTFEKNIIKAAIQGSCLQRIQMIVWDYMNTPKKKRDGVKMADKIFKEVLKTQENVKKTFAQLEEKRPIDSAIPKRKNKVIHIKLT